MTNPNSDTVFGNLGNGGLRYQRLEDVFPDNTPAAAIVAIVTTLFYLLSERVFG